MRIGVEETVFKELLQVAAHQQPVYFYRRDTVGF
jgi:hypothetical protein